MFEMRKNPKVGKTKNRRIMFFFSKCGVCDGKKSKFNKGQEASGILSQIPFKGPILFGKY